MPLGTLPDRINVCDVSDICGLAHGTHMDLMSSGLVGLHTHVVITYALCWWVLGVLDLCYGPHSNLFLSRKLHQDVWDPH